jgi:hypothetical protein
MATKAKKKTILEEQRIYIIVPEKVVITSKNKKIKKIIKMEPGRLMAQCCHVGRELEKIAFPDHDHAPVHTTIVLSARNTAEMLRLENELYNDFGITNRFATFHDANEYLYGKGVKVLTAIAVGPVTKSQADSSIGYLELYGAE